DTVTGSRAVTARLAGDVVSRDIGSVAVQHDNTVFTAGDRVAAFEDGIHKRIGRVTANGGIGAVFDQNARGTGCVGDGVFPDVDIFTVAIIARTGAVFDMDAGHFCARDNVVVDLDVIRGVRIDAFLFG